MRLGLDFFSQSAHDIAPNLLGKNIVRNVDGEIITSYITEIEVYSGENDLACHASKGRTKRNEIMYGLGGSVYVYLIYGMYWMLNFVTGPVDYPQAILIRGVKDCNGPGRLTKFFKIDKSFYGENLITSKRIWVEDKNLSLKYSTIPRVGIDYSGDVWRSKLWRYVAEQ